MSGAPIQPIAQQLAEARDGWHYANGVAELAMKHRDEAEAKVAELERQRDALAGLLTEAVEMSDNWPAIAYSHDLCARIESALAATQQKESSDE